MKAVKNYIKNFIFALNQVSKASPLTLIMSMLAMVVSGISPIVTVFFTSQIVDILVRRNVENCLEKSILTVLFITVSTALNFFANNIKNSLSDVLGCKLSNNIENIISEKSQKISYTLMDNPHFLDLYRNTVDKVGYEPINIIYSFLGIISSMLSVAGYFAILFSFNWCMPLIFVFISVPIYYLKTYIQIKEYDFSKKSTMLIRQIWYHFSLTSEKKYAKEVRVYRLFSLLKKSKNLLFQKFMKGKQAILVKTIVSVVCSSLLILFTIAAFEIWMVLSVISEDISVSQFVLFNNATISLIFGIISTIDLFASSHRSMLFLDFLFEFLNLDEEPSNLSATLPNELPYTFEFKNVYFKYPNSQSFCLQNINLTFSTGQKICLVGKNGSGKSTLIKLLLRIYKPSKGVILLNGIDIQHYDISAYYKIFGVVFQDYINFSVDVKKCIGFGNIDKLNDMDKIMQTSKEVGVDKFIRKYENGYNTNLSKEFYDDGVEPSLGQWQRLAITRGFYADKPVLVMDEPTASVDPTAEDEIFNALSKFNKTKAVIIISHRMSTPKLADNVILLKDGKICESGSHSDLMKNKNEYFKMYSLQAKKYS